MGLFSPSSSRVTRLKRALRRAAMVALPTLALWTGAAQTASASHVQGSDIQAISNGANAYTFNIKVYTRTSSFTVDSFGFDFGDGTSQTVNATSTTDLANDVTVQTFSATHTYTVEGVYTTGEVGSDCCRISTLVNGGSDSDFELGVTTIDTNRDGNSLPIFNAPPQIIIPNGSVFVDNPNASDPDGDALQFSFVEPPFSAPYTSPTFYGITINPTTGVVTYPAGLAVGDYLIGIQAAELNSIGGTPTGTSTYREFIARVVATNNNPPVVVTNVPGNAITVPVGTPISFNITGNDDLDPGSIIDLSGNGSAFGLGATLTGTLTATSPNDVAGVFNWTPLAPGVYVVQFVVLDDGNPNLSDQQDVTITVTGDAPLPVELSAFSGVASRGAVSLSWVTSSERDNAGFSVLRDGIEIAGYRSLSTLRGHGTTANTSRYSYTDSRVEIGRSYSYTLRSVDISGEIHDYARSVTVTVEAAAVAPTAFKLSPASPNPFNPSTTLSLSLPQASVVTAIVYNTLGQPVRTITSGESMAAGERSIRFEATGLATGSYVVRVTAVSPNGTDTGTQRLMLVK